MTGRARANGEGSIYPYRNGYAGYVWVTTPAGKRMRKYVYGKTRDEVHDKWLKLQVAAKDGPVTTTVPRIREYAAYWLAEVVQPNCAPLTYSTAETQCRVHIVSGLGDKRLNMPVRVAQNWLNTLARTCQCCAQGKDARRAKDKRRCCAVGTCCEQYLSVRTLTDIRACLRNMLSHAMTEELIGKNVAALIKVPSISKRKRRRKRKRWTTEHAKTFLVSARQDDDPLYAAYVMVIVLALRKGEVLGLPDDMVDLDAGEVDISYQLQRVSRQLLHRETKTEASDDTLPLPKLAVTALTRRRKDRERDRAAAGDRWHESGLTFTTRYGTPIEPRNFLRSWTARCRKAGVPIITVHDGRRSCASLLADLNVHPRVAMAILRHAQMKVTMEVYTEVSPESVRAALELLSDDVIG